MKINITKIWDPENLRKFANVRKNPKNISEHEDTDNKDNIHADGVN